MSTIRLNPSQKKAVEHTTGPLLIIAGAGTGKTRVITQRVSWLVEQKLAKSSEILALTFTNKAAQEMEERVDVAMPYGYEPMQISTFHSFCDTILRQEAVYLGLDSGYSLMSQAQEYVFFRGHLFDFSLDRFRPHGNPTKFIREILKHFSRLGDEDVDPEAYHEFLKKTKGLGRENKRDLKELATVYQEYEELKQKESKVGFADLVPLVLKLFREKPHVLKRYQEQFKYILVDEFQDTNYAQNELVILLAGKRANVTVVGDDDQSIYKFRGAAISNILQFKKTFPESETVVLTKNYRSFQEVLNIAYELIQKNNPYRLEVTEKIDKKLVSARSLAKGKRNGNVHQDQIDLIDGRDGMDNGPYVHRVHEFNDITEAESVAKEIEKLVESGKYKYRDIALLVRAHAHADEFIQSFRYHGIPFRFLGPRGLYARPEIKDLIAYLSVLLDYGDDAAMYRLLTLQDTVTPRESIELQRLARRKKVSLFDLLEELFNVQVGNASTTPNKEKSAPPDNSKQVALERILGKASRGWVKLLLEVLDEAFLQMKQKRSVGTILYDFIEKTGYVKELLENESQENEWKVQNIGAFFESIKRFESEVAEPGVAQYMEFLEYSLEIGESPHVDEAQIAEFDGVNVSTIHGVKGLEFPVVFLGNLVSERFPTRRRSEVLPIPNGLIKEVLPEGDEHLQEERRLCYVGMTRAQDQLYLTSADYYAQGVRRKRQSIFLEDVGLLEESAEKGRESDLSRRTHRKEDVEVSIPEDVKKQFLSKLKHNLSYSHISSYQSCPYQFYFKYVLEVPGKPSPSRSFGMTLHNTLRAFYDQHIRAKEGLEGVEKMPDMEDLLDFYDQKWQSAGYESKAQETKRYNAGKKALMAFYEKEYSENDTPVLLEGRFKVDIGDIRMGGVIDRLDKGKDGLHIIDYKTGNPKDEGYLKGDLQLPIYVLAMEQLRKEPVVDASLLYIEHGKKVAIEVTGSMKEKSASAITGVHKEIESLKFDATPGPLCAFCDYRKICDYANM